MANDNAIFLAGMALGLVGGFVVVAWSSWLGQIDAGRLVRLAGRLQRVMDDLETMMEEYQRDLVALDEARQDLAAVEREVAVYSALVQAQQMRGGETWKQD
jgi:Holliday junction resolvasome RuvABC endonuclease subunit